MSRRWVFDASPLIVLAKIDQSDLLEKLCDTPVIPEAVAEEIQHGPASDPGRQWLATQAEDWIRKTSLLPQTARRDLGRGERAVLSYALHHDCTAILDERTARRYARSRSLKVRGTLGILLLAKRVKYIERVRPHSTLFRKLAFESIAPYGGRCSTELAKSNIFPQLSSTLCPIRSHPPSPSAPTASSRATSARSRRR